MVFAGRFHLKSAKHEVEARVGKASWFKAAGLRPSSASLAVVGPGRALTYGETPYVNEFPDDYSLTSTVEDKPFAPSLATNSGPAGLSTPRSLAGSESCGTVGLSRARSSRNGRPSAHRFSAMDVLVPEGMQSGDGRAERRRVDALLRRLPRPDLALLGHQELSSSRISRTCGLRRGDLLSGPATAIRETDLQGNANYVMVQPAPYLWQWSDSRARARARRPRLPDPYLSRRAQRS